MVVSLPALPSRWVRPPLRPPMTRSSACLCIALSASSCALAQQAAPAIPPLSSTVVVVGSADPISLGQSSRAVVVLDTQEHPLAFQDVEDYLRTDASVDIQQRAPAGVQADISIRGASFEQTLVLLNGLRVDDAETSHFNLDVPVPLDAISGIDVLHGTGSTLYGSDAIGGVADILTLKPQATSLKLRAGGGSFGENQQAFFGSAVGGKWSEAAAGSRDFSTGFMADRDYRTEDASSETRLESPLGNTDILFAGNDRAYGANQFYGNYNSWERTKEWYSSLTQQLGSKTEAAVGYRRHSDIFVLLRNNPAYYKNQHLDESWEGALRRKQSLFRNGMLFYGLEEDTDQIESTSLGRHGRNQGAGYADFELRAREHGTISAGLREELFSGGRSVLSPMFAGSFWWRQTIKVRGSAGYGFRLPTYVDLYYSDPSTIGNPNLKPESAWNYDGGLDWYPNARTAASVTVFYSRQSNAIDYLRASSAEPWQASNLTGLRFTGVEGALDWRVLAGQRVNLSWTLLSGAQQALRGLESEYIFNYPVNNASVEWTGSWKEGLSLRSRIGVVERYQKSPYAVWDISGAREIGYFRPYIQITNLSNTGYQEIAGVRMQGRSLIGGIEFSLDRKPK
jgi:vitamin B12 transporter